MPLFWTLSAVAFVLRLDLALNGLKKIFDYREIMSDMEERGFFFCLTTSVCAQQAYFIFHVAVF